MEYEYYICRKAEISKLKRVSGKIIEYYAITKKEWRRSAYARVADSFVVISQKRAMLLYPEAF